jgi:hypothetical protein
MSEMRQSQRVKHYLCPLGEAPRAVKPRGQKLEQWVPGAGEAD